MSEIGTEMVGSLVTRRKNDAHAFIPAKQQTGAKQNLSLVLSNAKLLRSIQARQRRPFFALSWQRKHREVLWHD